VTIQNSDPFIYPLIDVRFLAEEADVSILREGCRTARRLFSAPAFEGSVFGSVIPPENVTSDQDIEDYLRNGVRSFLHGAGTASMSPKNANWGVVDPDFRVKGTTGLRIVDASVLVSFFRCRCEITAERCLIALPPKWSSASGSVRVCRAG